MSEDSQQESGTFSVILDKVAFVNKIPLLAKATSNDETPTPGYMFKELNNLTLESGSHCQTLLDYLVGRLEKDSYHVKLKVLRILKHIVENGHPDFRQGLRRRAAGINEASKYSGPPDPLHGNTPYLMVRKIAKELSQTLFEVNEGESEIPRPQPVIMRSTGGMGNTTVGRGQMEGFGNAPNRTSKSLGETIVSGLKEIADRVADLQQPNQPVTLDADKHFGNYTPAQLLNTPSDSSLPWECADSKTTHKEKTVSSSVPQRPARREHKPGVAGGGWDDQEEEEEWSKPECCSGGSSSTQQASTKSSEKSQGSLEPAERLETPKPEDWATEYQLVETIVMSGAAPIPSRTEVGAFVKRFSSLNCEKAIQFLKDKLSLDTDIQVMRAMVCLEGLLRSDIVSIDYIAVNCARNLILLFKSRHGPCQSKARKIIRQLERLCSQPDLFHEVSSISSKNGLQGKYDDQSHTNLELSVKDTNGQATQKDGGTMGSGTLLPHEHSIKESHGGMLSTNSEELSNIINRNADSNETTYMSGQINSTHEWQSSFSFLNTKSNNGASVSSSTNILENPLTQGSAFAFLQEDSVP